MRANRFTFIAGCLWVTLAGAQETPPADAPTSEAPAAEAAPPPEAAPTTPAPAEAPLDAAPVEAAPAAVEVVPQVAPVPEAPKGFTGVTGRIVDAETGEALIEATVKVLEGPKKKTALTDVDGYFKLKVPPGKYTLRVFYELYQGRRVENVEVKAGQATPLDVKLESDAKSVQEVVVVAKADRRNESALLAERKRSTVVSDAVGAQEMSRTPDSQASDAVKRVVSATVVDGRFVYLRGLGGRYSVTLLNGTLMPSPEPDEPSVPLDLFPVALLDNLNVVKTWSPELPGTFGGGALIVETSNFPTKRELKARLSISGDTLTTFQSRPTHEGHWVESFGFPGPQRALPNDVPRDGPLLPGKGVATGALENAAESFTNQWSAKRSGPSAPNFSLGLSAGDTFNLGGNKSFGVLAALQWTRKEQRQQARLLDVTADSTGLVASDPASTEVGSLNSTLAALLNLGLKLSATDEVSLLALYSRNAESKTIDTWGYTTDDDQDFHATRLQFVSRALSFNQLRGSHRFEKLKNFELAWQANLSRVDRSEPDTRDVVYRYNQDGVAQFRNQPGSGERFFSDLGETATGGAIKGTLPLGPLKLIAGGLGQASWRDFSARRFRFVYAGGAPELLTQAPEALFSPDNLGGAVRVQETTMFEDAYQAQLRVVAGHVGAEWQPAKWLNVTGGVRYEGANQRLEAKSPYAITSTPPRAVDRTTHDVLPAVGLTITPVEMLKLRAAYSYTLARATFRERAPFLYFDPVRRRAVSGNPDLKDTRIHNADLRAELFFGESEVIALSAFGKRFNDPIERVIVGVGAGDLGYANAEGANLLGGELEARASLGRLWAPLKPLKVGANVSLIASQIDLGPDAVGAQTSASRPLQGQSPWVVNASVSWQQPGWGTELTVLYNVSGPRISEVGYETLPDVFEQPFHRLDVALSQPLPGGLSLKLSAQNLLNQAIVLKQGEHEVVSYRPGMSFGIQLGWTPPP